MTDHYIHTSQNLLKHLEEEITVMRELMRNLQVVAHNMNGTWTAIRVTQENCIRDLKEKY